MKLWRAFLEEGDGAEIVNSAAKRRGSVTCWDS
jgi:hypothetical protein